MGVVNLVTQRPGLAVGSSVDMKLHKQAGLGGRSCTVNDNSHTQLHLFSHDYLTTIILPAQPNEPISKYLGNIQSRFIDKHQAQQL